MMSCEEFETLGLDMDRRDANAVEVAAASQHAASCARCYALLSAWRELKQDLRLLHEATSLESAPLRVEMRLKQELRTRLEARVPRRSLVAAWALAAAAVVAAGVEWKHWSDGISKQGQQMTAARSVQNRDTPDDAMLLAADYDPEFFTQLPDGMPSVSSDETLLQMRVQRGALMQFGLPVEPERSSEWVDVDFLVSEDGQPTAVRLHQDSQDDSGNQ